MYNTALMTHPWSYNHPTLNLNNPYTVKAIEEGFIQKKRQLFGD